MMEQIPSMQLQCLELLELALRHFTKSTESMVVWKKASGL